MVKHLEYEGKKLPVRLSYSMFKALKTELGENNPESILGGGLNPAVMEAMLYYGLISGHKAEQKGKEEKTEFAFKREDMEDILDECMFEFVGLIPLFFPKAKTGTLGNALANLGLGKPTE